MSDTISLTVEDAKAQKVFAGLAADRRAEALDAIGHFIREEASLNFTDSQSPYGVPWAPLQVRKGGQPLLDTGRLRNSLAYQVQGDTVEVGSNVLYAGVHQQGMTISAKAAPWLVFPVGNGRFAKVKQVTIPQRAFLPTAEGGLPQDYEAGILDILEALYTEQLQ